MKKIISQSHYRRFDIDDIQAVWHLADVGVRTCDMLLETATTPEQFEKTAEVKETYEAIQREVENSVEKSRAKKSLNKATNAKNFR